jgi:hypothetical protein
MLVQRAEHLFRVVMKASRGLPRWEACPDIKHSHGIYNTQWSSKVIGRHSERRQHRVLVEEWQWMSSNRNVIMESNDFHFPN